MAQFVLTDASVIIDSNDISDHVASVTINYSSEIQDKTAMGDTSRNRIGGLKDWSVDIELHQDFASSNIDSIMFPLVGTSVSISIKPTSASASATNPKYNGNILVESYQPLSNSVGELATTTISLPGDGNLTRSTS